MLTVSRHRTAGAWSHYEHPRSLHSLIDKMLSMRRLKRFDADVLEQGLHADAQGLGVAVDGGPDFGFTAHAGAADSGEDRCDDVVAQGVIGHPPTVGGCGISRQPDYPEGATPSGRSPGRSVATL